MVEDKSLVEKAKEGDRAAFGELVKRHQQRVYATAFQMTGDCGEADDIAQETFLRAFVNIDRFDGRSEFNTWLYRITVNLTINHLKKRGRRQIANAERSERGNGNVVDAAGRTDPAVALEKRRFYIKLARAMESLPEPLKSTVVLVSFQGLSHRVVAEILGCSEGTVSWRIHEARKLLRDHLDEDLAVILEDEGEGSHG